MEHTACGDPVGAPRNTRGRASGGSDVASLLPGVVFQLVVVMQTVIAVVWSWPITAYLTALRVTGTFQKKSEHHLEKMILKQVSFTLNYK